MKTYLSINLLWIREKSALSSLSQVYSIFELVTLLFIVMFLAFFPHQRNVDLFSISTNLCYFPRTFSLLQSRNPIMVLGDGIILKKHSQQWITRSFANFLFLQNYFPQYFTLIKWKPAFMRKKCGKQSLREKKIKTDNSRKFMLTKFS